MEEIPFFIRSKNFSVKQLLDHTEEFGGGHFYWENPKFTYLLKPPLSGWEDSVARGRIQPEEVPEKPSDDDLLPFIEYLLREREKAGVNEEGNATLKFVKQVLENSAEKQEDIDLVQRLYDLDELEKSVKVHEAYISEKNKAKGFVDKVVMFGIDRVREIINKNSKQ